MIVFLLGIVGVILYLFLLLSNPDLQKHLKNSVPKLLRKVEDLEVKPDLVLMDRYFSYEVTT